MKRTARFVVPVVILAVGFFAAWTLIQMRPTVEARPAEPVAPVVRVIAADPQPVHVTVSTQGTVVPRTESDLVPQIAGEVVWISPNLVSGGFFDAGEPLVRIDRADAGVELQSARAAVARAESEFERAETDLARQQKLLEQGVTSKARIDDARNAFRVAEAGLREAKARLSRAQRDYARTELRAPFQGRVRSKQVDVGQFVNRGNPIARLYAVDQAEVRLPLPDRELRWLDLPLGYAGKELGGEGPAVRLSAEFAGRPRTWEGHIVRTEGEIDPKSRMVHVVARVDDPYGKNDSDPERVPLAVGLFVEAEIDGRRIDSAIRLPREAIHASDDGAEYVHLVDGEARLRLRPVEVLRRERDHVLVGNGLEAGERVSVSALPAVVDGMAVRVAGEDPANLAEDGESDASGEAPLAEGDLPDEAQRPRS